MKKSKMVTTTFQLSEALHTKLKLMCVLSKTGMGEFIRLAIVDKINQVKIKEVLIRVNRLLILEA